MPTLPSRQSPWPKTPSASPQLVGTRRAPPRPATVPSPFTRASQRQRLSAVAVVRELPLFSLLPNDLQRALAKGAHVRRCVRDEAVLSQGQIDRDLHVLLSGRVHAERIGLNGKQVLLAVHTPGQRLGEMSLIDGEPHNATARCVQASQVLVLGGDAVWHCLQCSPGFARAWAMDLVGRLRQTNRRILSMALDDVRERVLHNLTQLSETNARGQRVVGKHVARSELAGLVGASREMVCRVLRRLHDSGHIELRADRSIVLIRPPLD